MIKLTDSSCNYGMESVNFPIEVEESGFDEFSGAAIVDVKELKRIGAIDVYQSLLFKIGSFE